MNNVINQKLLGVLLQDAHLISDVQIQIALIDQQAYGMRLGDVLVLHGWLKQQTIDFFITRWNQLLAQGREYSLEYCLQEAGLLSDQQIELIRQEQIRSKRSFGNIAVQQRWVKPQTIDFFESALNHRQLAS
ncbi:MAG: hypothetical protein VKJ02_00990 [Snowella sp.]|nr:hypothetical protein [Snowella sp.]